MTNTSATGGYLADEVAPPPLAGADLDAFLQGVVAGVTGLPDTLVLRRWQPVPAQQPAAGTDWCAVGVTEQQPDANAYMAHDGAAEGGLGVDRMQRHERLTVLCTFYGPTSDGYADALRDCLYVAQNREALTAAGMALVEVGPTRRVPELTNGQWIRRCDIEVMLRRVMLRTYPVENILSSQGSVETDSGASSPWSS